MGSIKKYAAEFLGTMVLVIVGCGTGALKILELTPESSKTMDAASFLNGLRGEKIGFPLPGE